MLLNLLIFSCRISTPFDTCCTSLLHVGFHPLLISPKILTSDLRQQPNPSTQATVTEHWTRLILSYGRFKKIWLLKLEDAEVAGNDWDEILRNDRINRKLSYPRTPMNLIHLTPTGKLPSSHLGHILKQMVAKNQAIYDPPKQTRSVLLYWRTPEEWAEVLHEWVCSEFLARIRLSNPFSFAGDLNRPAQYYFDVLRDHRTLDTLTFIWDTTTYSSKGNKYSHSDEPCTDYYDS